jgi:hypothetical protein
MEESLHCLHSFAKDFDEHARHRQFTPDVIALVTGLVEGLAEHALPEGVEYHPATEQEPFYWLQFPLLHALDGEVATRSRLGCGFILGAPHLGAPCVRLRVEERCEPEVVLVHLENQCLLMTPVEHAEEAFEQLIPVWEASGCTTRDERRQRAWQWWKEENHKADFEGGKLWKHVESLDGSMHARAIPAHKMASALTGALCGTRAFITCFEYSMFSDGYAQVACHMEKDMRTDDENHPYYDPHSTEKTDWAQEMVRDHMASTSDRMLAERFAPSAANFGLMYAEMHRVDLRAADPAKVARLMSHCRNPGGAGFWDMTAQRWQKDDMTFKATGSSEGRIIWSAIESTDGL